MPVVVIQAAQEPLVSLEDAKAHLRVDHADDDDYISSLVTAAARWIGGATGWLGRSLVTETLELQLPGFCGGIVLPLPPTVGVDAVRYTDVDGNATTVPPGDYRLVVTSEGLMQVVPARGKVWPTVDNVPDAVRIEYRAGYGAADDVPQPIRHAALLLVGQWYEARESVGPAVAELPFGVRALLAPFRCWL